VGNFASQAFSLAAVGTCAPAAMLFVFWSTGFSGGGSVVIAQYFGAGKTDEIKRSISTLLLFTLISGLIMTAVGILISRWFLRVVLIVTGEILPMATAYLRIYCVDWCSLFL
jgi:Na+-driven multidrug efflux pump